MLVDNLDHFGLLVMALCVVLMASTGPVAATPDGGILEGENGGDGELVGNLTDSVDSTTDAVSESVSNTTDSTAGVLAGDNASPSTSSTTRDEPATSEDTSSVTDAVSFASGSLDESTDDPVADDTIGGTDGLGIGAGSLPLGPDPLSTYRVPTEPVNRDVRTKDLPVTPSQIPVDQVPLTGGDAPVQPEDSPYGSEGQGNFDACTLPVTDEDLPTESVPERGDLPVQPTVPGLPLDLLTPDVVAGIVFGVPPRPCEAYDPHNPSVDPTNPPGKPSTELHTASLYIGTHHIYYHGISRGHLEDGGVSEVARWGMFADDEEVFTMDRVAVSDGTTDHYLYLETWDTLNYQTASGSTDTTVGVLGNHVAAEGQCEPADLANASVDFEDPTGPCEYWYDGVPTVPAGAETVIDALENPPQPELPVNLERLIGS